MAPLGSGETVRRPAADTERQRGRSQARGQSGAAKSLTKSLPATWPHVHEFIGKGDKELEIHSEVLERTVTPEAHEYFRRIVQVTQSELEKLLVYKIQQLFDPVAPATVAEMTLEQYGASAAMRLQMPCVSGIAHLSHMDGQKGGGLNPREGLHGSMRQVRIQEKAVAEGRDLTKCLVGILGRVLADFGRFADTILRWKSERRENSMAMLNAMNSSGNDDSFPLTGLNSHIGDETGLKELIDRLERQNQQNTALEAKYSSISSELRDNRRAFMRERAVWQEKFARLKGVLKRSSDPALAQLLEHEVQFFEGEGLANEEDLEIVRQRYEERIAQMKEEYEGTIADLQEMIERLQAKLKAFEERPVRKDSSMIENLEAKVAALEEEKHELEELIQQLQTEASGLHAELAATKAANDALEAQLAEARTSLEEFLSRPPTKDAQSQTDVRRRTETLHHLKVDVPPEENETDAIRKELMGLQAQMQQLEEQLADERRVAAQLREEVLQANGRAEEALMDLEVARKEFQDKASQWENERLQLLSKATSTITARATVASQTASMQPSSDEEALRARLQQLESESAQLRALLDEARSELERANTRIKALEAALASASKNPSEHLVVPQKEIRRSSRGGGFRHCVNLARQVADRVASEGTKLPPTSASIQEIKFHTPPDSQAASPRPRESQCTFAQEHHRQEMDVVNQRDGYALDCPPQLKQDVEKVGVESCEKRRSDAEPSVSVAIEAVERRPIAAIIMPVSGYAAPVHQGPSSVQASSGITRASYGGGFSALETTGWKGTERPDTWPGEDATNMLLPSPPVMKSNDEDPCQPAASASHGWQQSQAPSASHGRKQPRPSSAPAAGRGVRMKSRSVPQLAASANASEAALQGGEREQVRVAPYRLPTSSASRAAASAAGLSSGLEGRAETPVRPQSAPNRLQAKPHPVLRCPTESRVRPQSASTLQNRVRPQSAGTLRQARPASAGLGRRPGVGSAIFDG